MSSDAPPGREGGGAVGGAGAGPPPPLPPIPRPPSAKQVTLLSSLEAPLKSIKSFNISFFSHPHSTPLSFIKVFKGNWTNFSNVLQKTILNSDNLFFLVWINAAPTMVPSPKHVSSEGLNQTAINPPDCIKPTSDWPFLKRLYVLVSSILFNSMKSTKWRLYFWLCLNQRFPPHNKQNSR